MRGRKMNFHIISNLLEVNKREEEGIRKEVIKDARRQCKTEVNLALLYCSAETKNRPRRMLPAQGIAS